VTTFAESLGFKKGAILPFAAAPYSLNLLSSSHPLSTKLEASLGTNVNANFSGHYPDHALIDVPFSIMLLAPNDAGPHVYAGWKDTQMNFSASLLKPGVMYAAFELLAAANRIAAAHPIPNGTQDTQRQFLSDRMNDAFAKHLERYPFDDTLSKLTPNCPQYTKIFKVNATVPFVAFDDTVNFGTTAETGFEANLKKMITHSGNPAAAACIDALGFTYINCALAAGGFFTALPSHDTGHGIWISGDYALLEARLVRTEHDGMGKLCMDTSTMCRLFALIEFGQLVDAASSATMHDWLAQTLANDVPWIITDDHDHEMTLHAFDVLRNKLGVDQLGRPATATRPSTLGQNVFSECSVLGWKIEGPPATSTLTQLINKGFSTKVIVCWQNWQEDQMHTFHGVREVVRQTVREFAAGNP